MFKDMNIKKVSLWLFVIMVMCFAIAITIFFQTGGYDASSIKHAIDDSKNLSIDGIKQIQINTVSIDINVTAVDTNEVYAHLYGDSTSSRANKYPKLIAKIENSKLIVKIQEPFIISIGNMHNNLKLDVSIPKAYAGDLDINTTSGDTNIDSLNLNYYKHNSVSGNLVFDKLMSKDSKLSTVSGNFTLTAISGNLSFNSVSGDLSVNYPSFNNNLNIDTTSGDSKIILPENAEFYLDFDSVSGDANCSFPLVTDGRQKRAGLKGGVGSEKNEIHVSSVSGDLYITK